VVWSTFLAFAHVWLAGSEFASVRTHMRTLICFLPFFILCALSCGGSDSDRAPLGQGGGVNNTGPSGPSGGGLGTAAGGGTANQPGGTGGSSGTMIPTSPTNPVPAGTPATVEQLTQGEVTDSTGKFVLWIPPGAQRVKGLVYLNMTLGGYYQESGERQLASTWGFAHLTGMAWNNNLSDSFDIDVKTLDGVVAELASKSGHAELLQVPVVGVGLSRTGGTGFALSQQWKGRVLAHAMISAAFPKGPAPSSVGIPSISVVGDQDNYDAALASFRDFRPREGGMLVATAINRGVGHKCGPCNQVLWPFLDRMVRSRLQADGTVKPADRAKAWLGNPADWSVSPADQWTGTPTDAAWLPDASVANAWRAFTMPTPTATFATPPNDLGYASKGKAGQVEIEVTYAGDSNDELHVQDGDVDLGVLPSGGSAVRKLKVDLKPGLHVLIVMKNGQPVSRPTGGIYTGF
jgi:hypothetical protein